MWKMLSILQKNLVWPIPISMALGLLFGYLSDAAPLKLFIIPVTFIMVYPMTDPHTSKILIWVSAATLGFAQK